MSERDDRGRRRVVDAGRRVTEHSSGDRQALNVPPGLGLWNPKKPGAYKIEIIPFEVGKAAEKFALRKYADVGDLYYERTYWMHARIGVNGDSYVCSAKTFGKQCPICEHRAILARSPKADDEKLVSALKPKERQLFLIVDHDEPEKGVQLWEVSFHNFGKQLDAKINNADDEDRVRYRRFADPEEGLTLKLMASEETTGDRGGKYLEFAVDEFRARKTTLDPDWLEHGFCLDDMVRAVSYDELKKIFLQTGDDEEPKTARDERDTAPARKRPAADDEPAPRGGKPTRAEANGDGADVTFARGDAVEFDYRDKVWTGTVVKHDVDRKVVHVELEGRDKPQIVDVEDVRHLPKKKGKSADEDPPARKRAAADDEPVTRTRNRNNEPVDDADDEPPPRGKTRAAADDEDPPARKRPAARDEEDEPPARAAKPAARRGRDDWDD